MSTARQKAIQAIANTEYDLNQIDFRTTHLKDLFGLDWSSARKFRKRGFPSRSSRHSRKPSARACNSIPTIADAVASAMKDWALEHGATHYTHLFQPMTGLTAEKHDSFLSPDRQSATRLPNSAARNW